MRGKIKRRNFAPEIKNNPLKRTRQPTRKQPEKTMKSFKVTFFEKFDIFSVETFHNVTDQSAFIQLLAVNIVTLELAPVVRCEANGQDYTEAVNHFLREEIAAIQSDYAQNWYANI